MNVVVVGAGIAGSSTALALCRRGHSVRIVDRPGLPGAATPASAGMLAPLYEADPASPLFPLRLRARDRYAEFLRSLEELAGTSVRSTFPGMLVVNGSEQEHEAAAEAAAAYRRFGAEAEVLEPAAAGRLSTGVGPAISYLWLPSHGWVDARALAEALRAAVEAAGAEVRADEATGLVAEGDTLRGTLLGGGDLLEAEAVVVAAGAWSAHLAGLPRALGVRPVRGQILVLGSPVPDLPCLLASRDGHYLVPLEGGSAIAGSTMEETGFDASVSRDGLAAIRRAAERLAPGAASGTELDSWAGLRPVSTDGLPILGRDPELEGLWYATGYGRSGILLAPYLAEVIAGAMDGEVPDRELASALKAMRPDRLVPA